MVPPKCFVSYSWEEKEHQDWVRNLASELQKNGIETSLDQWDLVLGDDLTQFMETCIRESNYVLLICTPIFAEKANKGVGGVGYEKSIVTGEIYQGEQARKFIPILRKGTPNKSLPSYLKSRMYIDFRDDNAFNDSLVQVLRHLHQTPKYIKPPLGDKPQFPNNVEQPKSTKTTRRLALNKELVPKELKTILEIYDWKNRYQTVAKDIGNRAWFGIISCPIPSNKFILPVFDDNKFYSSIGSETLRSRSIDYRAFTDRFIVFSPGPYEERIRELIEFYENGLITYGTMLQRARTKPIIYESGISACLVSFLELISKVYNKVQFDENLLLSVSLNHIQNWTWKLKRTSTQVYNNDLPSDVIDLEITEELAVASLTSGTSDITEQIVKKIKRHFNIY